MAIQLKQGTYFGQHLKEYENEFFKLSVTSYEANHSIKKHYHQNSYLSILTKGCYSEKNSQESVHVSPGNILFRPGCYVHKNNFSKEGGSCFNVEFKPAWQMQSEPALKLPAKFGNYSPGVFPSLYSLFLCFKNNQAENLAWEFIAEWLCQVTNIDVNTSHKIHVEKVIRIVNEEIACFHSLESLSKKAFVHPVYLARSFKHLTGITVHNYQLKLKLEDATSLLLNTSLSISDITHRYGFYDDAHFIRSFKSVYTVSPYRFRIMMKS